MKRLRKSGRKAAYEGPLHLHHLNHLVSIYSYISRRNPLAATRVLARLRAGAEGLADFPAKGRVGEVAGTHEWVVRGLPYVIVYEIHPDADEVVVLGVYHGAQQRPGQEKS